MSTWTPPSRSPEADPCAPVADAGWRTWAKLVTLVRLALLPVFVWLLFGTDHRALAAWLLGMLGGDRLDRRLPGPAPRPGLQRGQGDRPRGGPPARDRRSGRGGPGRGGALVVRRRCTLVREVLVSVLTSGAGRAGGGAHRRAVVGQGLDVRPHDDVPALSAHHEPPPPLAGPVAARRARHHAGSSAWPGSPWRGWCSSGTCGPRCERCAAGRGARRVG